MQEHQDTPGFDFDGWADLAQRDPQAFELKRTNVIESVIRCAPQRSHQRLRRLQWKLDRIRETSANPMAACVRMQALLWDSVLGDEGLLARLEQTPVTRKQPRNSASILEFRHP